MEICLLLGNGPSGICLSYLLNGYKPYLDTTTVHPNSILYRKLQEAKHLPITEQVTKTFLDSPRVSLNSTLRANNNYFLWQDLEYLSEGLEGRSRNPVAVLFDTLLHPNADFGYEFPPVIQWKRDKKQHIPHLVLGKGTPGGAWHVSNKDSRVTAFIQQICSLFWHCLDYLCRQWRAPCWLLVLASGWSYQGSTTETWPMGNAGKKTNSKEMFIFLLVAYPVNFF